MALAAMKVCLLAIAIFAALLIDAGSTRFANNFASLDLGLQEKKKLESGICK